MMAYLLICAIITALFLAGYFLFKYGNIPRQHPIVTFSILIAWCFSFLMVFALPLDITSTVYRQCIQENANLYENGSNPIINTNETVKIKKTCQKPWGMVPKHVFPNLWRVIYWTSQFLTWLIMPLMQSYLKAGDFTIKGKLKSSLVDNAIYYGSYLFICGILLIYIAFKGVSLDWQKLKAIASSASNTWGLFLLILLLGYALVEVPRSLWNNSKPGYSLQYAYFKASKLSSDKAEAEENVDDVLESLQAADKSVPNNHQLRPYVDTILQKIPTELLQRASRNYARGGTNINTSIVPTEKALIRIHKQVIKSLQTLQRTESLWGVQVEKIFHLEDVSRNMHSAEHRFKCEFPKPRSQMSDLLYSPVLDWYWECLCKYPFLKCLAVITATLSLMVVWSELTFFNRKPVLSLFAGILNIAKDNYDFLTIEMFSAITLCYLCYCAYSTVFRIKFLNLYYLAPHHQTNEHSLIFSGMLLCRLTPPMCLNFLGLIHMDSHIIKSHVMETYYTQIMGHMDVIGIISDGFNIYFPMLMLAFCLATWFSVGSRALNALGFQQFLHNETIVMELVQEGRDLILREKRRRQRAEETIARKRNEINREMIANPSNNTISLSSYRSLRSQTPSDSLLRGSGSSSYTTLKPTNKENDLNKSLSQEINERFGLSTNVQVGFKNTTNFSAEDNNDEYLGDKHVGPPPRGIFDDV